MEWLQYHWFLVLFVCSDAVGARAPCGDASMDAECGCSEWSCSWIQHNGGSNEIPGAGTLAGGHGGPLQAYLAGGGQIIFPPKEIQRWRSCIWKYLVNTGTFFFKLAVYFCLNRSGGPEPASWGGTALQLHSTELFRLIAGGAEKDGRHLLAQLPAGEALWRELCMLLSQLLRLPVLAHQSGQKIPWGI